MHSDNDDPELRSLFADLHRRESAGAPDYEPMKQHALLTAGDQAGARGPSAARILWWAAPAACAAALALWLGITTLPSNRPTAPQASAQRVEQLLDSIEQHFDADEAVSAPTYATDALLTQIDIQP